MLPLFQPPKCLNYRYTLHLTSAYHLVLVVTVFFLLVALCHSSRSFRFWNIHYSLQTKYIYSYLSVWGHLDCFHALIIFSNATNEDLYTRFVRHFYISWVNTYSELLACILNIVFYFCRKCQTRFQSIL